MLSRRGWWLGVATTLPFLAACGADGVESTSTALEESGHGADLDALIRLLDDGGTIGEYDEQLTAVVDESSARHASTWSLLLTPSEESFNDDNFNPGGRLARATRS